MANKLVVTIDGPSGAGKSTVAKLVAKELEEPYIDSGAIYRALSLYLKGKGIAAEENDSLKKELPKIKIEIGPGYISVNGTDVTNRIRTPEIDAIVSKYSALKCVRNSLIGIQRAQLENGNGLVADGRDMGTVVYPEADVKIFLTATAEERARRRCEERLAKGEQSDFETVLEQIKLRDKADMTREVSPLRPAENALILDSTEMTAEQVSAAIVAVAKKLLK